MTDLTSESFPGSVFHYTDQQAFIAMLGSKAIWATDIRYLNDSREYLTGFEQIVAEAERCAGTDQALKASLVAAFSNLTLHRVPGVYVASFSLAADDLSQWRAYSGGSGGISIGFEPIALARRILLTGSSLGAVRYSEAEHADIVRRLCAELVADARAVMSGTVTPEDFHARAQLSVQLGCALMKHHKFADEREWRMVVWSPLPPYAELEVRHGRSAIVPYLRVRLDTIPAHSKPGFANRLPLDTVWVGPTPHPYLAARGVAAALGRHGEHASIELSQVPFRNW